MYVHENGDPYGILIGNTLDLGGGVILTEGKLLEAAIELRELLMENKFDDFYKLVGVRGDEIPDDQQAIFQMIQFPEFDTDIWNKFWEIYDLKIKEGD